MDKLKVRDFFSGKVKRIGCDVEDVQIKGYYNVTGYKMIFYK